MRTLATLMLLATLSGCSGGDRAEPVWEDDRHLLGTASTRDGQAMVRVDLTGHLTRVGPVEPAEPYGAVFETRP